MCPSPTEEETDWTRLMDAELTHDKELAREEAERMGLVHHAS